MERATKRRRVDVAVPETDTSVPGFAKWNLEQDYEQRPRNNKKKEVGDRLLVKSELDGKWEEDITAQQGQVEEESGGEHEDHSDAKDSAVADVQFEPTSQKPKLHPKKEIRLAKEELARVATLLSEDPEEHIGLLGSLAQLTGSENVVVKKLGLGTQLAVFRDIIPGYRIRPLSKDDMQAKVSKEVKKLRSFEQGLLQGYKTYVLLLGKLANSDDTSLSMVAITCACNLLTALPHFNCRNELTAILVQRLSIRQEDTGFDKSQEAVELLFQEDEQGHASLEVVSQLTKMMKSKGYNVHEGVLNTFLHLRLLSEFAHKASTNRIDKDHGTESKNEHVAKKKRVFRTKRERKLLKERKEVASEMKEADAVVSYEERDKNQAETLKLVFVTYFRILKVRTPHLMGAVLEGLAKYAHLINQDFFGDILEALKDLITDSSKPLDDDGSASEDTQSVYPTRNATRESLLCIITAFALLQGQVDVAKSANSLHLDLDFFTAHLYRTLMPLSVDSDIELSSKKVMHLLDPNGLPLPTSRNTGAKVNLATTTVLLLRSLHSVLLPPNTSPRSIPPVTIAAFTKQLLSLSLHIPTKSAQAVLALLQQVVKAHGVRIASLWNTEERKMDGVFDPVNAEVGASNVFASSVWEGELLRLHFCPEVREGIREIGKTIQEARSD